MKNPTRFYGILLLILGFILCVFDRFLIGFLLILVGLVMAAAGQPKKNAAKRVAKPLAPPVQVPGAPAADAYAYSGSVEDYFADLLRGCFPVYSVQRDVPVSTLSAPVSSTVSSWECPCGTANTGNFCSHCGKFRGFVTDAKAPANDAFCIPVTFLLRSGGQAQLAILICDKNRWNNVATRNTIEACNQAGIPCLRFIRQFRHRSDYTVERITAALR